MDGGEGRGKGKYLIPRQKNHRQEVPSKAHTLCAVCSNVRCADRVLAFGQY